MNELEVIVDESTVQIASLQEQLTDAQQRCNAAESVSASLQETEAGLQQRLQALQVCPLARCPACSCVPNHC